jgi:hypothetical protein
VGQQYFENFPIAGASRHVVDVERRNVPMSCFSPSFLFREHLSRGSSVFFPLVAGKKLGSRTVVDSAVDRRNIPMT